MVERRCQSAINPSNRVKPRVYKRFAGSPPSSRPLKPRQTPYLQLLSLQIPLVREELRGPYFEMLASGRGGGGGNGGCERLTWGWEPAVVRQATVCPTCLLHLLCLSLTSALLVFDRCPTCLCAVQYPYYDQELTFPEYIRSRHTAGADLSRPTGTRSGLGRQHDLGPRGRDRLIPRLRRFLLR